MFILHYTSSNDDFAPLALWVIDLIISGLQPGAVDNRPLGAFSIYFEAIIEYGTPDFVKQINLIHCHTVN